MVWSWLVPTSLREPIAKFQGSCEPVNMMLAAESWPQWKYSYRKDRQTLKTLSRRSKEGAAALLFLLFLLPPLPPPHCQSWLLNIY